MKYTICGFQQDELVALGFDSNDAVMLRWVVDFFNTDKMAVKIHEDRIFFWVNYKTVIEELPISGISNKEIVARRFDKWAQAGLVKKLLVKGMDEFSSNGRKGSRSGTFTYFSFDSEALSILLGDRLKSRALTTPERAGVYPKVEPGSTSKSEMGLPEGRTKDPSPKNSSPKNNSIRGGVGEIIHQDGEWVFYSDQTATYNNEPTKYNWDSLPRSLPYEVMAWRDARILESQTNRGGRNP